MHANYRLRHVIVQIQTADAGIAERIGVIFGPFASADGAPDIMVTLHRAAVLPAMPTGTPVTFEEGRLAYFLHDQRLIAHFTQWGQLRIDLNTLRFEAFLSEACLATYSVLEDMVIIGLAPLLRRRRLFTVHAFAAARAGRAVLIIGDIGAGKTTTGISLLRAGWSLLSNDSPLLAADGSDLEVVAYPGLLSAFDDSLARFPEMAPILADPLSPLGHSRQKRTFAAERLYPGVWTKTAAPAALCFPQITPGLMISALEPLSAQQALLAMIPQSIENWDKPLIPQHFSILGHLAEVAPAFRLRLAPDVEALPALLSRMLPGAQ